MNARDVALIELDLRALPNWHPRVLRRRLTDAQLDDPRDRALADHLVTGVIKNLLLLQHLIEHYSGRKLKSIDVGVQIIIAIGLFQLRFLTGIPARAAVDEAVEQTRRFGFRSASGFVNAVLRKATREPDPPLPDEATDPQRFAEIVYSHPADLFKQLVRSVGQDSALQICRHNQSQPPVIVRLSAGVSIEQLTAPGVTVTPHEAAGMIVVTPATRLLLAKWADAGLAQAQDPTSAAVVDFLDIQPGQLVLDRCCGRGTKTMQMLERVGSTGRVVAMDPADDRIESLRRVSERREVKQLQIVRGEMIDQLDRSRGWPFDRILIDAPCSNSGVLARRPEARYRQSQASLDSVAKLQLEILRDTLPALAPEGKLAYSTCSIWPEENRQAIETLLKAHPEFRLIEECSTLPYSDGNPAQYHDGGYVAVLQRRSD